MGFTMQDIPATHGWRMPAEWETHEATWIAWPHNQDDWPGKFGPIPWVYAEIVRHLHYSENVTILVADGDGRGDVRAVFDGDRGMSLLVWLRYPFVLLLVAAVAALVYAAFVTRDA